MKLLDTLKRLLTPRSVKVAEAKFRHPAGQARVRPDLYNDGFVYEEKTWDEILRGDSQIFEPLTKKAPLGRHIERD